MKEELNKLYQKALAELEAEADKRNREGEAMCLEGNEAPCSVCGKSKFVLKYRDTSGKIEGKISGSFSLFGGSISGYVDGEVHTDPILSCRDCENERRIELHKWVSKEKVWNEQIPYLPDHIETDQRKVSEWLQQYGAEVAYLLGKKMFNFDNYKQFHDYNNDYPRYSDREFEMLGLKRRFPELKFGGQNNQLGLILIIGTMVVIFLIVLFSAS